MARTKKPAAITLPVIHLNGTSAARLREGYAEAYNALEAALASLVANASPHGRDYYPVPGSWEKAEAEHASRIRDLERVKAELAQIALHCAEHDGPLLGGYGSKAVSP